MHILLGYFTSTIQNFEICHHYSCWYILVHVNNHYMPIHNCLVNVYIRAGLDPFWPEQNGFHCGYVISKCIFMTENVCILIKSSLKFVSVSPIINKSALVDSGNGLAPNRWLAITWTNDDLDDWQPLASQRHSEFYPWSAMMSCAV